MKTVAKGRTSASARRRPEAKETHCPREGVADKQARAGRVLLLLRQAYPRAATELVHKDPFELLVATVLSAQATDVSVNKATPALFVRFPDAASLARAEPVEVEALIRTIGLYHTKARNLVALARGLVERHACRVPADKAALMALPGVGWKTATVVLAAGFGVPGIAVDTHLTRLAARLCFSQAKAPELIGKELEQLFPRDDWVFVHHALILHGRYLCTARKPSCHSCALWTFCPSKGRW